MKFMTWNVNGIRALTQYHPYCDDLHKNYREILDFLDADVICLQETKITRSKLESDLALVPGYDSYWSFHRTKSGYSGVVIYVKDHLKLLAAEEGISGILSGNVAMPGSDSTFTSPSASSGQQGGAVRKVGGYPRLQTEMYGDDEELPDEEGHSGTPPPPRLLSAAATFSRFQELDSEGRGIILDFGFFVLFNLYCPNETDETRLPFKMDYYHVLEARVQELIQEGREVMILGDMNVIPTELDHCDPEKWKKESGRDDFRDTQPRRWFNSFLAPMGPMTDLYRVFHEGEKGAFTCWNTKINARPSNYGTRLDYILVTPGLVPWFKSCDRRPQVVGSDHCPVVAEMFIELPLEKGLAELDTGDDNDTEMSKVALDSKKRLQDILDSYGGSTDHALAAKYFDEFSGKQQKLSMFFKKPAAPTTTVHSPPPQPVEKRVAQLPDASPQPKKKLFFSPDQSTGKDQPIHIPTNTSPSSVTPPTSIPSSIQQPQKKNGGATGRSTVGKATKKPTPGKSTGGQQSMLSFFSSPPSKKESPTPTKEESESQFSTSSQGNSFTQSAADMSSQSSVVSVSQQSQPLSPLEDDPKISQTSPSSTFRPSDFADWIPGSNEIMPFLSNAEETTSTWQNLFQPRQIPKCRLHNVACTEYTVNKKGPNKGRRFFLCSLPIGPEGDAIGQKPEFRCDYFEWRNPDRKK